MGADLKAMLRTLKEQPRDNALVIAPYFDVKGVSSSFATPE